MAAKDYPGQDISQLITHVQSWVIVFIGFGEGTGGILGSLLYELIGFRWQYDVISCCVIAGFVLLLVLDAGYEPPSASKAGPDVDIEDIDQSLLVKKDSNNGVSQNENQLQ